MPHLVSTMTHSVKYTLWKSNPGGINTPLKHVLVKGGHGVARRDSTGGLHTPNGVTTQVSEEDLEFLLRDEVFQLHVKNKAITVLKSEPRHIAKVTADMGESPDRPLTPKDSLPGGRAQVPDSMKVNRGEKLQ